MKLPVEIGVAGGASYGLAEDLEFGLGALDAGGQGVFGCAAGPQAGDGLQGKEQQEAEGGGYGQLAAEAGAVFQLWIVGAPSSAAIWSRARPSRGKAAVLIKVPARRNCQAGSSS